VAIDVSEVPYHSPTALEQALKLGEISRELEQLYGDEAMEAMLLLSLTKLALERIQPRGRT